MKQICCVMFFVGMFGLVGGAQEKPDATYGSRNAFTAFVNFSNDSSHMIIGQEKNRKLVGFGAGYAHRFVHKDLYDFTYEVELRPLTLLRDPVVSGTTTYQVQGNPTISDVPVGTFPFSGPTLSNCASGTTVSNGISANGIVYTKTVTQTCGERWSYLGGFSPLGIRFNTFQRHRVQPFFVGNAGCLVATHDEPVNYSSNFNFTFEVGVGVQWFQDHRRSYALDYRVHHLSNAYSGYYNPGIDSGVFRLSARFGR